MKAKYNSTVPGLQKLPPEIKVMILEFLDARSKLALSQTNYGWRDLIL
ncbi:F-box protein, partial [Legionella pneumophila]